MIELKDIYFSYDGERVIRGASLSLGKECVALVGPNGSGKTTLLKIMAGIYRPDRGEVIIEGRSLWKLPEREAVRLRRKVVYVHERPIVLRGSVMYNATFGLRIRGTEEASSRVIDLLKEVGIEDLSRDARTLSAGQAQLLALVRAIVVDPLYLLLDEPFANLDLDRRRIVLKLLTNLKKSGRGIIIATHDVFLAARMCSRAYVMREGVVREVEPSSLLGI